MTAFLSNLVRRGVGATRADAVRPPYVPQFTPVLARPWRQGLSGNEPYAPEPPTPADHPHEPASTSVKTVPKAPDPASIPAEEAPPPSIPRSPQDASDTVAAPRASRTRSASPDEGNSPPRDPTPTERPEERTRRTPDVDAPRPRVDEPAVAAMKVPDPPEISMPPMPQSSGSGRPPPQHDTSADPGTTLPPLRSSAPQDSSGDNAADIREAATRQSRVVRNRGEHADRPASPENVKVVLAESLPLSTSRARRAPRDDVIERTEPARRPPARKEAAPVARPEAHRGMPPVRLGPTKSKEQAPREPADVPPERGPVQVRIGTVEVRASTPPAIGQPPESHGFDGYLAMRTYAGWEGT
jgi:hypothetical protein